MTFQSINPATEEKIAEYELLTGRQLDSVIENGHHAFQEWRRVSFDERADLMRKAGRVLKENKAEYARTMTLEMGKPITQAEAEVDKCAWVCDYNADNAQDFLADEIIKTEAGESFVTYQPMGVIFAIMPWNYPFWQVFRFAAPHLMAGNAGMLKHAPNVGGCAQAIEDVFHKAGFPDHIFQNLFIDTDQAAKVIAHPRVRAVTLTGSVGAGKAVASEAGKALKKAVLELGGSDAYLVLDDADLDTAVDVCVGSRLINSGQSCINAKRFIVDESRAEEFEAAVVERMRSVKIGDPLDPDTEIGPMARNDLRDNLNGQVEKSLEQGAERLAGAKSKDGKGYFYIPGALGRLAPGMPAYDEELFGPVASIIRVRGEAEAIEVANNSAYGLGSGVISKDEKRARRIAREELDAGASFVNQFVKSDPRLPFGGVKHSGYGRELSVHGIREFVNIKSVSVK